MTYTLQPFSQNESWINTRYVNIEHTEISYG